MKTSLHCKALTALFGILLLCGCQSSTMKGTPFYTGEYEGDQAQIDRVNLWPVLYYRDPALSILWPIFELTDDHTAVRPLFSVYNKTEEKPVYNVLWPFLRFDTKNENNRIFPVFWGKNRCVSGCNYNKEYCTVFPFYWHFNDPFDDDGLNALFPLWIWNVDKEKEQQRLDVLWPLYANKTAPDEHLWRLWPLYGTHSWKNGEIRSRFWAGGLVFRTDDKDKTWTGLLLGAVSWKKQADQLTQSMIFPFYSWDKDDYFYTLLYGRDQTKTWYATPLVGRYHKTRQNENLIDCKGGWVWPLWGHKESEKRTSSYAMAGIWHHYKTNTRESRGLFPVYQKKKYQRTDWKNKSLTRNKNERSVLLLFNKQHISLVNPSDKTVEERFSTRFFPLWRTETEIDRKDQHATTDTTSWLLWLYDTRRETPHDETRDVYTRNRILWRLYHKETLGKNSSTDIFPAIAIDRKENGFRKYALLWRLFRYEHDPEADTTKLDLFFIPLKRS
ncbi:MAG: hypothetical protein ISR84_01875 [Kiritimatiellales bacterium]|nr:hypothetical protein [Kiritimatiellales bacterium]